MTIAKDANFGNYVPFWIKINDRPDKEGHFKESAAVFLW